MAGQYIIMSTTEPPQRYCSKSSWKCLRVKRWKCANHSCFSLLYRCGDWWPQALPREGLCFRDLGLRYGCDCEKDAHETVARPQLATKQIDKFEGRRLLRKKSALCRLRVRWFRCHALAVRDCNWWWQNSLALLVTLLQCCFAAVQLKVANCIATAARRVVVQHDAIFRPCGIAAGGWKTCSGCAKRSG
jgi:hypothetical protein